MQERAPLWSLVFLLIFSAVALAAGPRAYITESVSGDFFWNGTANGAATRTGVVEVWVPNTVDVLQYIRLNLTGNQSTNIIHNTTYNSVAVSATAGARTIIYVNTSGNEQNTQYTVTNANVAPAFVLSLNVSNNAGGGDIYSNDNNLGSTTNTLNFTVSIYNPSANTNFTGLAMNMTFNQTYSAGRDVLNITTATIAASSGTVTRSDLDGDGDFENVRWTGGINQTQTITFTFLATMLEGTNYPVGTDNVNLNGMTSTRGARADWSNSSATLTGIGFQDLFSRGPIREGIDLAQDANGNWRVRGFIQNVANNSGELAYTVHNWTLWNVSGGTPTQASLNYTGAGDWQSALAPAGGAKYTTWYSTGITTKPYYAVAFNWEVDWDTPQSNFTSSQINTTMRMQTLNQIDLENTQSNVQGILLPLQENISITIEDEVSHVGSTSLRGGYINIFSVIPNETTLGTGRFFTINTSTIRIWYRNDTSYRPLKIEAGVVNYTFLNPSSSGTGYVNATVFVLSSANMTDTNALVGVNLSMSSGTDFKIRLNYSLLSPNDLAVGDEFSFNFNGTLNTESGTPIREEGTAKTIMVASKRLLGYKDLRISDPNNPTVVNTTINIQVTDKNGTGIAGIKFIDYLPNGTNITTAANIFDAYNKSLTLKIYNASYGWLTLSYGANYTITNLGWKTLSDGAVVYAFEINSTVTDGWTLYDGQQLEANYFMNITSPGLYVLPVVIAAFDPSTGLPMDTSAVGFIKVTTPVSYRPAVVTEGELELAKTVIVGKPAAWIKTFEAFNPNIRPLQAKFSALIFKDTVNAFVSYTTEAGEQKEELVEYETRDGNRYVVWEASLYPQETRTYTIRILTPPVIEVERKVADLSQMSEKLVKVSLDVYLKNLADEDYRNVKLYLPVDNEKIFSARDDSLTDLVHSPAGEGSAIITIDEVKAKQILTVSIQYRESYPVVIITTDKDNYEAGNPVGMSILVINGGEKVSRPYVETEIYSPELDLMYSSVQNIKSLKAVDQTEVKENFELPSAAPTGNYLISARFREDFATITQGNGKFYVIGASGPNFMVLGYLVILVFTIVILFSSIKRIREIRANSRKFEQAQ